MKDSMRQIDATTAIQECEHICRVAPGKRRRYGREATRHILANGAIVRVGDAHYTIRGKHMAAGVYEVWAEISYRQNDWV